MRRNRSEDIVIAMDRVLGRELRVFRALLGGMNCGND